MLEANGNLWESPAHWKCITTNGFVKNNGEAVMGRGCAREAAQRHPKLPKQLGSIIKNNGNHVGMFPNYALITFPVKHHWREKADIDLIKRSCHELELILLAGETAYLPRPGCGNGQLNWSDVRPEIEGILSDKVTVITF